MCAGYPLDSWWKSPLHTNPYFLSELSIKRMTKMLTPLSAPPNCEYNWWQRVSRYLLEDDDLPWPEIWTSVGCTLLSPTAEYTWLRLIHRSLYVLSKQQEVSQRCHLCRNRKESLIHLPFCPVTRSIRCHH